MKSPRILSACLLLLALACVSTGPEEESELIFDGSTKDGWSSSGDNTIRIELATDSNGNDALSVTGQEASNATFSLAIEPGAARGTVGITFRVRGSMDVRFSATTTGVKPAESGGTCTPTSLPCWDIHGANLDLTPEWQTVVLSWEQLQQTGAGVPVQFDPGALTHINFAPLGSGVFNIWVDDIAFLTSIEGNLTPVDGAGGTTGDGDGDGDGDLTGTGGTSPAAGGTTSTGGTTNTSEHRLGKYVSNVMFLQEFSGRNPLYSYTQLLAAVDQFPGFAACCSESQMKREIAAFMAHVEHESDHLAATEEYTPPGIYCQAGQYPCAAGKSYHGRGALQLTWNYNYSMAQDYFTSQGKVYSPSLLDQPEQVATNQELLWTTALWFWMVGDPSYVNDTMHDRINSQGFGSTIQKINGALECNGAGPQQVQQRIDYYTKWCNLLGVDPGSNLSC